MTDEDDEHNNLRRTVGHQNGKYSLSVKVLLVCPPILQSKKSFA